MSLTLTNLFKFISLISPFILYFIIFFYSLFYNSLLPGLLLLFGGLLMLIINLILKLGIKDKQNPSASILCNLNPYPLTLKRDNIILASPSNNLALISFILFLVGYSMFDNNNVNYFLLTFLILLFGIVFSTEIFDLCTSLIGGVMSIIIGIVFGLLYYFILKKFEYNEIKLTLFSKNINKNKNCKFINNEFICSKSVDVKSKFIKNDIFDN
jgi:hypothetical protein